MEEENKEETTTTTTRERSFSDNLATAALSAFASLPKTGKPQPHEHTAFAAIAVTFPPHSPASTCLGIANNNNKTPVIITMATGTKCLPGSKRAADGSALNDCHAEVLARRALLRWMYDEIQYAAPRTKAALAKEKTDPSASASSPPSLVFSIIEEESGNNSNSKWRVELLEGVQIHMFTSHPPCGDATIVASPAVARGGGGNGGDGEAAGNSCECQGTTNANGMGRTGAKPLIKRQKIDVNNNKNETTAATAAANTDKATATDWVLPQAHHVESYDDSQATDIVRRKPGRGEPTLSVSCSDKLAKWSILGLQGALLSSLLARSLYLSSLVVGAPCLLSKNEGIEVEKQVEMTENSLKRAFQDRIQTLPPPPPPVKLETYAVALSASDLDTLGLLSGEVRRVPCGTSITWRAAPSAQWRLKPAKQHYPSPGVDSGNNIPPMLITEGFSESITGLFGSKAGAARKGADNVPPERQSALCRAALFKRFLEVSKALETNSIIDSDGVTYAEAKNEAGTVNGYKSRWNQITLSDPPLFEGWIEKPSLGSEFCL